MGAWLQACGIKSVVMQSRGVYWMAVYGVLQRRGFDVHLVDARGTKNLPGRKSDVQECQWLLKLHTYGLLRRWFLPGEEIRRVRTVWRLRDQHVKEAGRAGQHMQKALTEMNVQLHNTISDLSGVTGQAIVRAILDGEAIRCIWQPCATGGLKPAKLNWYRACAGIGRKTFCSSSSRRSGPTISIGR